MHVKSDAVLFETPDTVTPPLIVNVPDGGITELVLILLSTMSLGVSIGTFNTLGVLLNETFTMLH